MSNLESFDFNSLKKMSVDKLFSMCRRYIRDYISKSAASRFDKAYKEDRYDDVKDILEETLRRIKSHIKVSEYKKAEKAVVDEFPAAIEIIKSSDTSEGSQDDIMGTGSGMIAVIVIIVAFIVIAIVCTFVYLKDHNKTVGEVLSFGIKKDLNSVKSQNYSDKDRDLIKLIHELAVIYDNIDQYLNS